MSIGSFVSASLDLKKDGQYDAALALACSAVDATSAKCYPNERLNNKRYKAFLKENMRIVTSFGMPGINAGGIRIKCLNIPEIKTDQNGMATLEAILYHVVRCGLIHQCNIEMQIEFTDRTMLGDFDEKFKVPYAIIFGLIMAVILSNVNSEEKMPSNQIVNIQDREIDLNTLWGQGAI